MTQVFISRGFGGNCDSGVCLTSVQKKSDVTRIGIMQIVEHPALDVQNGFIQRLAELGFEEGKTRSFRYRTPRETWLLPSLSPKIRL